MKKQNGNAKSVNIPTGLTASTFSMNGKKGKPARPKGMKDVEWCKVNINIRVPKMLKAMESVARLSTIKGFSELPKTVARILRDMNANVDIIEKAFAAPKPNATVKKSRKLYAE